MEPEKRLYRVTITLEVETYAWGEDADEAREAVDVWEELCNVSHRDARTYASPVALHDRQAQKEEGIVWGESPDGGDWTPKDVIEHQATELAEAFDRFGRVMRAPLTLDLFPAPSVSPGEGAGTP